MSQGVSASSGNGFIGDVLTLTCVISISCFGLGVWISMPYFLWEVVTSNPDAPYLAKAFLYGWAMGESLFWYLNIPLFTLFQIIGVLVPSSLVIATICQSIRFINLRRT